MVHGLPGRRRAGPPDRAAHLAPPSARARRAWHRENCGATLSPDGAAARRCATCLGPGGLATEAPVPARLGPTGWRDRCVSECAAMVGDPHHGRALERPGDELARTRRGDGRAVPM